MTAPNADLPQYIADLNARIGLPATVYVLGLTSLLNDAASDMIYPLLPLFLTTSAGVGATPSSASASSDPLWRLFINSVPPSSRMENSSPRRMRRSASPPGAVAVPR